jgi:hypothetical protein
LRILWQKWIDPIAPLVTGSKQDRVDEEGDGDSSVMDHARGIHFGPGIIGPLGIVPLHESILPSRLYNFWMANCDFDLSARVVELLECVRGVETLDIFTRYRFRVAIGKVFDEHLVKQEIEKILTGQRVLPGKIDFLRSKLPEVYTFWAILINHKYIDFVVADTPEGLRHQVGVKKGPAEEIIWCWDEQTKSSD